MNMKLVKKLLKSIPKEEKLKLTEHGPDEFWFGEGYHDIESPSVYFATSAGESSMSLDALKFFQKAPEIVRYLLKKLEEKK